MDESISPNKSTQRFCRSFIAQGTILSIAKGARLTIPITSLLRQRHSTDSLTAKATKRKSSVDPRSSRPASSKQSASKFSSMSTRLRLGENTSSNKRRAIIVARKEDSESKYMCIQPVVKKRPCLEEKGMSGPVLSYISPSLLSSSSSIAPKAKDGETDVNYPRAPVKLTPSPPKLLMDPSRETTAKDLIKSVTLYSNEIRSLLSKPSSLSISFEILGAQSDSQRKNGNVYKPQDQRCNEFVALQKESFNKVEASYADDLVIPNKVNK